MLVMDLRRTDFSIDEFGSYFWIYDAAARTVSTGICFAKSNRSDSYQDMGGVNHLFIFEDARQPCPEKIDASHKRAAKSLETTVRHNGMDARYPKRHQCAKVVVQ